MCIHYAIYFALGVLHCPILRINQRNRIMKQLWANFPVHMAPKASSRTRSSLVSGCQVQLHTLATVKYPDSIVVLTCIWSRKVASRGRQLMPFQVCPSLPDLPYYIDRFLPMGNCYSHSVVPRRPSSYRSAIRAFSIGPETSTSEMGRQRFCNGDKTNPTFFLDVAIPNLESLTGIGRFEETAYCW